MLEVKGLRTKLFSVSIEDCRVECIASTQGAGGQNKNRRHTAVRITHPPSGAVGMSADERTQLANKRLAFTRLAKTPAFRCWATQKSREIVSGKTVDQLVDEAMAPEHIRAEGRNADGMWEVIP